MLNKKMFRMKSLAILVAVMMLLSSLLIAPFALAAEEDDAAKFDADAAAKILNELDLFRGRGDDAEGNPDFDLGSDVNRAEGIVMLIRLLGV